MTPVAMLVPVLRRPQNVLRLIESVANATGDYRLLFIASEDDDSEIAVLEGVGADYMTVGRSEEHGQYAKKINAGYRATGEPFIFLGADDLHFHPGWLSAAFEAMADPAVGVVGTQDLGNPRVLAGTHATHSLVRRSYVDEFGTIDEPGKVLHESYPHEFCDDELVQTAMKRNAWAFAADSVVEHMHPNWGKGDSDALYEAAGRRMRLGRKIYWRRQVLWR